MFRTVVLSARTLLGLPVLFTLLALCGTSSPAVALADEDLVLPSDPATLDLGKERYGAKCSGFCHGSGGKGGRAPCLVCGKFKRGGTNAELVKNITEGVKNSPMGAFGEVYSREEIVAIVAYLRNEQKKKEAEEN
jgi:mono/diheme cytochrome c family protein